MITVFKQKGDENNTCTKQNFITFLVSESATIKINKK